jgi:hypothetical protein
MANDNKALYLVIGHATTGSGTLTFPEDIDVVGLFTTRELAQSKADSLNREEIESEDIVLDEGECMEDALNDSGVGRVYEVSEVSIMG